MSPGPEEGKEHIARRGLDIATSTEFENAFKDEYDVHVEKRELVYRVYPKGERGEPDATPETRHVPLDRVHPPLDAIRLEARWLGTEDPRGPCFRILVQGRSKQQSMVILLQESTDAEQRRYLQHRVT